MATGKRPVIKTTAFLAHKPGTTHAAFLQHWVETHAPMHVAVPGLRGYLLGIPAQSHSRADVAGLAMGDFDGVAQLWFDDEDAMAASQASPGGQAWLADLQSFTGQALAFVTQEEVALPIARPRPGYRALSVVKRKPGAASEDFQRHWREIHATMAREVPDLRGFVVSGILAQGVPPGLEPIALDGPIDGFAESWVEDLDARARMVASPEAKRWFADGAILFGAVKTVVLEDRVIVPPPQ